VFLVRYAQEKLFETKNTTGSCNMNISKPSSTAVRLSLAVSLLLAAAFAAQAEIKFYTNVVMIQYYDNIPGTAVSALTGSPKFPNSPDRVVFAATPEVLANAANNYGARITGVLFPLVVDESYHLIMCSDDQGELHLSSNTNAANKVLVAREPEWNDPRKWAATTRRPDTAKIDPAQLAPNVSLPIVFNPAQPRYFELLMKEGGGGDNLAMTTSAELSLTPVPPDDTAPDFTDFGLGVSTQDGQRCGRPGDDIHGGLLCAARDDFLSMVQKWHSNRGRYLRGIHVHAGCRRRRGYVSRPDNCRWQIGAERGCHPEV
jgi:hypothetical protein